MIYYQRQHNFIEIGHYTMASKLNNRSLVATIFQEEIKSPMRKRLTNTKVGLISYADTNEEIEPFLWTDEMENEFIELRNRSRLLPLYSKWGPLFYLLSVIMTFLFILFILNADFKNSAWGSKVYELKFLNDPSTDAALVVETTSNFSSFMPYKTYYVWQMVEDTVFVSPGRNLTNLSQKSGKRDLGNPGKTIKISKSKMLQKVFHEYGKEQSQKIVQIKQQDE